MKKKRRRQAKEQGGDRANYRCDLICLLRRALSYHTTRSKIIYITICA